MDDLFSPFLNEEFMIFMDPSTELSLDSVYQCERCTAYFPSVLELKDHMRSEHDRQQENCKLLDVDLKMKPEPYTPLSASTQLSHEEMRVCPSCGKECKGYKGLKQHLAKMHSPQTHQVQCNLCDKYFKHKYALRFHVKQVHDRSTRVNCLNCGKSFYNKYILKKHNAMCDSAPNS